MSMLRFWRRPEKIQRLNLDEPPLVSSSTTPEAAPPPEIHPASLEAVMHQADVLLKSGRIQPWVFVCNVQNGLLSLRAPGDHAPVMLLFSNPFAASDYLRATGSAGSIGQVTFEALPKMAQSGLSSGVKTAIFDRCPRCPQALSFNLADMAHWTNEDYTKVLAHHRATRLVLAKSRIQSSMKHCAEGFHAEARSDLEYVRDHFDCSVPFLHQVIGLLAGTHGDEAVKAVCIGRLKEFGPQFAGSLDFSAELLASAMVGLAANFGIIPGDTASSQDSPIR